MVGNNKSKWRIHFLAWSFRYTQKKGQHNTLIDGQLSINRYSGRHKKLFVKQEDLRLAAIRQKQRMFSLWKSTRRCGERLKEHESLFLQLMAYPMSTYFDTKFLSEIFYQMLFHFKWKQSEISEIKPIGKTRGCCFSQFRPSSFFPSTAKN